MPGSGGPGTPFIRTKRPPDERPPRACRLRGHDRTGLEFDMTNAIPGSRTCAGCDETKPLTAFDARGRRCRDCRAIERRDPVYKARQTEYRRAHRERQRLGIPASRRVLVKKDLGELYSYRAHILRRYGLTPAEFDAMVVSQSGLCDICLCQLRIVNVDHDHTTGRVRGLLCRGCNIGIGAFSDEPERMVSAVAYVEKHRVA